MKTSNKILMQQARESLKGKWWLSVEVFLVYIVIMIAIQAIPYVKNIIPLIVAGPFLLGVTTFILAISKKEEVSLSQLFVGFKYFWKALGTHLLKVLFIFLWTLLFIIPGIVAVYAYSMTFFILAEDKNIKPIEALRKSKAMMKGNKWKLFCLGLRFIGWMLLCILTLGIGFLWLMPYGNVSTAKFYEDLKKNSGEPKIEFTQ